MKFRDDYISQEHRYSIGVELESGKSYLAIPVSNGLVDYEEYYEVADADAALYRKDINAALTFVNKCRNREADDLLLIKPGANRGVPA